MDIGRPLTVMLYEWRRSIASRRFFSWIFLVVFPVLIVGLVQYGQQSQSARLPFEAWSSILYFLIPCVCCLLSLLLTSAPYLQSELEGRTWIYMAIRPGVKTAMLRGKYLYAVGRTIITALVALAACILIGQLSGETKLIGAMIVLIILTSLAYASVFAFIGTIVPRRAMVVAVVYTLIEFGLSLIPAMINQFTIQYRLRSLLMGWMDMDTRDAGPLAEFLTDANMVSDQPWWLHVLVLLVLSGGLLAIAQLLLNKQEFAASRDE